MWARLKHEIWQWRGVLIAAPSVAVLVILLRYIGLLQLLEWSALDQFFRLRPLEPTDPRIVLVGIDEVTLTSVNWPMSDAVLAELLTKINQQQPRAIGLDLYRNLPVQPGYENLVKVFRSTPNLIGIEKVVGDAKTGAVPPPPELKKLDQVSSNDMVLDADGKMRRGLLYLTNPAGESVFSLSFKLALIYLQQEGISPQLTPEGYVQLGSAVFPPFSGNDGGYVRADAEGYQVLMNFRGARETFETVSMIDVMQGRVSANLFRDRIVLIGSTAESLKDFFYTPYSSTLFKISEPTSGVELHATLTSQLLSTVLDGRSLIKVWPEPLEWLWILGWSLVGALLSWRQRHSGGVTQRSPWVVLGSLLIGTLLLGGSYAAFLAGWWISVVPPLLALAGSSIAVTAYVARTAGQIRKTFGRYLTDQIVAALLESPEGLKLGGERRNITILTSDIRGFTAISERFPAEEVIRVINLYLGYMADVITHYQGTIDEFMGDGILVLFGAPVAREDDVERSIACAVAMQLSMKDVNEKMAELGLPQLEMGIGINTGEVVVGNIGSEKRTKYGVVGNQVNLAYRIESYTVGGQILISESTFKAAHSIVIINEQREVQPKGVHEPIKIYDVGGIAGKHNLFLSKETEEFFPLSETIKLQYAVLDGKHVSDTLWKGTIIELSAKGAAIHSDAIAEHFVPAPLSNIRLNLFIPDYGLEATEDIYAKVLEQPAEGDTFYIRFTNRPPEIEAYLNALYQKVSTTNND